MRQHVWRTGRCSARETTSRRPISCSLRTGQPGPWSYAWEWLQACSEQPPDLGRDLEVLPRLDHQRPHGGAAGADLGIGAWLAAPGFELDSEESEPGRRC